LELTVRLVFCPNGRLLSLKDLPLLAADVWSPDTGLLPAWEKENWVTQLHPGVFRHGGGFRSLVRYSQSFTDKKINTAAVIGRSVPKVKFWGEMLARRGYRCINESVLGELPLGLASDS